MIACALVMTGFAPSALASSLTPPTVPAGPIAPLPAPYDTQADAQAEVAAAFTAARGSGRLVLLDFGANWCPDCRILAGVMDAPTVAPWVNTHFVPVRIDVGRFNKNMDIARRYGVTVKGIPALLVLRPDGTLLDPDGTKALSDARTMTPQAMMDLIADWGGR
jgi:thiol-disulfide isomerase/thioredoxin